MPTEKNKRFRVDISGLGIFPDVIFLKIKQGREPLKAIHISLIDALQGLAVAGRFEGQDMIPHVTLLHFSTRDVDSLASYAETLNIPPLSPIEISEITLVKSHSYRLLEIDGTIRESVLEKVAAFTLRD